jgi:diguanylate cyclase (GGDEF)-like protein/PAS domain S-box-containing protein
MSMVEQDAESTALGRVQMTAAEHVQIGVAIFGPDEKVIFWNPWLERHSGIEFAAARGRSFGQLFAEHAGSRIDRSVKMALRSRLHSRMTPITFRHPLPLYRNESDRNNDQRIRQVIDVIPLSETSGGRCAVLQILDVSGFLGREEILLEHAREMEAMNKALSDSKDLLRRVLDSAHDGILTCADNGEIVIANPAAELMFGYGPGALTGKSLDMLLGGGARSVRPWGTTASPGSRGPEPPTREFTGMRRDGESFPIEVVFGEFGTGTDRRFVACMRDITERKRWEEQLTYLAHNDALTGLPNRKLFQERLEHEIALACRASTPLAVMFLDLDKFKQVNDKLGHNFGDGLLRQVGQRLKGTIRDSDTVARLGGDEFAIIQTGFSDVRAVCSLAERIIDAIQKPYEIDGQLVEISTSIGITLYPQNANNPEELLKNADIAMYQAKVAGRNKMQFFSREMQQRVVQRTQLEWDLARALEKKEMSLVYQPSSGAQN